ncbi:hypothetical protein LZ554_002714 [Drepanopeziza brunnea f. sp. 'monogermtubi']|nr:hypothetical protein LZ554_002714 [Drepanopeziza brunnea f. sp. 'monogermtubi']
MKQTRPNFIDTRSLSHGPLGASMPSPSLRGMPSPRLHVAGDVPPELSPLDAFAAQSRQLARQLEQESVGGKRVSRLPPLTIANSLSQPRPGYFRSVSAETPLSPTSPGSALSPGSAVRAEVETPGFRPKSVHPALDGEVPYDVIPPMPSPRPLSSLEEEEFRGRRPPSAADVTEGFGARRESSPTTLERDAPSLRRANSPSHTRPRPSAESMHQRNVQHWRGQDASSLGVSGYGSRALAPPRSPFGPRAPSPKLTSNDSSDEDLHNQSLPMSMSPRRKASNGSSNSPTSPIAHVTRSASTCSELSIGGTRLPRPAFNFSRPLSRGSSNSLPVEAPSRQASSDSQPSFILADDTAYTPQPAQIPGDTQKAPFGNVHAINGQAPPSPPSRPSTSSLRPSLDRGMRSYDRRPSLDPGRPKCDRSNTFDCGRPATEPRNKSPDFRRAYEEPPTLRPRPQSSSGGSTPKAKSQHSIPPASDCSADEHVTKAIEYHEAGALNKSTYHLRLAAKQSHPTGMLLYALACRHGWGMRPNQKEGVAWLRRAADFASLEVADAEDHVKDGKTVDMIEQRTRKAQFALSIYELGVSHMNGWGIDQDKALALRCFEIAGAWGDADALAEAGFCYAQGMGCKKDLKKSARFYRQAEAKGISMVGNSWIYKPKYNDEAVASDRQGRSPIVPKEKDKKVRNKSRTRMFARKP